MAELTTVPSFVYYQGQPGDDNWERPIDVQYYNGSIMLEQQGGCEIPERIQLNPDHVKALFKEIIRHLPEAEEWLKK